MYKSYGIGYEATSRLGFLLTVFFTFVYFTGYAENMGYLQLITPAVRAALGGGITVSFDPNGGTSFHYWKRFLFVLLLMTMFPYSQAGCPHCYDQLEGCMGGDTCPFVAGTAANVACLTAATGAAVAISVTQLLPREYLRVFSRQVLDILQASLRRPLPGNSPDIRGWSVTQLMNAFHSHAVPPAEVARELTTLVAGASEEESREIKLALDSIRLVISLEKETGARSSTASEHVGFNLILWALAGRVADRSLKMVSLSIEKDEGETGGAAKITEKLTRVTSMEAFSEVISIFCSAAHALGKHHILATTRFFRVVVYDTILRDHLPWQLAHELLMIYFEDLDNSTTLTLGSIIDSGAVDARMARAKASMAVHYKNVGIFRPASNPDGAGNKRKFNGKDTPTSSQYCLSYNLKNEHPHKHLHPDGACRHKHVCDQWVTQDGDGHGRCGGNHPRKECKHPHKSSKPPGKE